MSFENFRFYFPGETPELATLARRERVRVRVRVRVREMRMWGCVCVWVGGCRDVWMCGCVRACRSGVLILTLNLKLFNSKNLTFLLQEKRKSISSGSRY